MNSYQDITYKYLKKQKKRTILTIVGIILSVALITSIGTLIASMRDKMVRDAIRDCGDYHAVFKQVAADKTKNRYHKDLESSALICREGTAAICPVSEKEKKADPDLPANRYLNIKSYDQKAFDMFPVTLKEGRLPQKQDEIAVEYWVLDYLPGNPGLGDSVSLDVGVRKDKETNEVMPDNGWDSSEVFLKQDNREFTLVGLIKPKSMYYGSCITSGITFLDSKSLDTAKNYDVYIKMKSLKNVHEKAFEIAKEWKLAGVDENAGSDSVEFNETVLRLSAESINPATNRSLTLTLSFIIALVLICTIAVIYNAFNISVLERISQFGVLRCTGASPRQIKKIVLKEAGLMSLVGIPLGLFFGILSMKIVMYVIAMIKISESFDFFGDMQVVVSPVVLITSIILGLITVYLSALGPARQAARISPLEAVRNTGSLHKEDFSKVKRSTISRYLLGIEGQIAFKNLRRNRKRFRITVFSLVISIVLYIVFSSFVGFIFKMGAVSSNVNTDFIAWNNDHRQGFTLEQFNEMKSLPGVEKVFKKMNSYATVLVPEQRLNKSAVLRNYYPEAAKDENVQLRNSAVISYGDAGLAELKKYLKEGSIDEQALNEENGVILLRTSKIYDNKNNKFVILDCMDYRVGEKIMVSCDPPSETDEELSYQSVKVLGVLDKGIFDDEYNYNGGVYLITTEKMYNKLTGNDNISRIDIKMAKDADREPVAAYFKELQEKDPRYQYIDETERARDERNTTIIMSIFLYGFVGVITLIGCVNIFNTISTNLILRTRELSVLRSVGMTRKGIRKMVSLEGVFYGATAALYGSVIGVGLSYLLFKILIDLREFPWTVPWNNVLTAVLGALLITWAAGYLPLKKINGRNIVEQLRMEE